MSNELQELLDSLDNAIEENESGAPKAVPASVAPVQPVTTRRTVEVATVAEWYSAHCLGNDRSPSCGWTRDGEVRDAVFRHAALHVAQTNHTVHVDTSNVHSVILTEENTNADQDDR